MADGLVIVYFLSVVYMYYTSTCYLDVFAMCLIA